MSSHKDKAYQSTSMSLSTWRRKHLRLRGLKIRGSYKKMPVGQRTRVRKCMSLLSLPSRKGRGSWISSIIRICWISRPEAIRERRDKARRRLKRSISIILISNWWHVIVIWNSCRTAKCTVNRKIIQTLNSKSTPTPQQSSKNRTCKKKQ